VTRIISGAFGGRRIDVPAGAGTRPTSDRVREALFARLDHQDALARARVLDLYAGSGALGLEALSRGAAGVVFVESGSRVLPVLKANVAAVGLPGGRVVAGSVPAVVTGSPLGRFDLVLADPPYATPVAEVLEVLGSLVSGGWLAPEAVLVVERSAREELWEWPTPLVGLRDRRYGEALLRYGRFS